MSGARGKARGGREEGGRNEEQSLQACWQKRHGLPAFPLPFHFHFPSALFVLTPFHFGFGCPFGALLFRASISEVYGQTTRRAFDGVTWAEAAVRSTINLFFILFFFFQIISFMQKSAANLRVSL